MLIPTLTPSTYERIATTISQYGKRRLIDINAWERALNGSRTYLLRHNTYLRQPRRLTSLWYGFLKATIMFRHFSLDSQAYWSSVTARRPLWDSEKVHIYCWLLGLWNQNSTNHHPDSAEHRDTSYSFKETASWRARRYSYHSCSGADTLLSSIKSVVYLYVAGPRTNVLLMISQFLPLSQFGNFIYGHRRFLNLLIPLPVMKNYNKREWRCSYHRTMWYDQWSFENRLPLGRYTLFVISMELLHWWRCSWARW